MQGYVCVTLEPFYLYPWCPDIQCMFFFTFRMEVLVTLTTDAGRILTKLHEVAPRGDLKFINGVRIAHVSNEPLRAGLQITEFFREPNCIFKSHLKVLCKETSTSLGSLQNLREPLRLPAPSNFEPCFRGFYLIYVADLCIF